MRSRDVVVGKIYGCTSRPRHRRWSADGDTPPVPVRVVELSPGAPSSVIVVEVDPETLKDAHYSWGRYAQPWRCTVTDLDGLWDDAAHRALRERKAAEKAAREAEQKRVSANADRLVAIVGEDSAVFNGVVSLYAAGVDRVLALIDDNSSKETTHAVSSTQDVPPTTDVPAGGDGETSTVDTTDSTPQ